MKDISYADQVFRLDEAGEIIKARELCELEECAEDTFCLRYLGWYWLEQGDFNKSLAYYTKAAVKGDIEAQTEGFEVIQYHIPDSNQTQKNAICKSEPYNKFLIFQRYLAKIYYQLGDMDELLYWSIKIAEHGAEEDLLYVGFLLENMNQPILALEYLKQASVAGNIRANNRVGDIYAFGLHGIPKDIIKAIPYYEASAEQGSIIAQKQLLQIKYKGFLLLMHSLLLALKAGFIAILDKNDPRLTDIPNCDKKKT